MTFCQTHHDVKSLFLIPCTSVAHVKETFEMISLNNALQSNLCKDNWTNLAVLPSKH